MIFTHHRRLAIVLTVVFLVFSMPRLDAEPQQTTLVVHVYDIANVPMPFMLQTEAKVQEALARIGVRIIWMGQMSRPHSPASPAAEHARLDGSNAEVWVEIVKNAARTDPAVKGQDSIMGVTPAGQGERSYVFYDHVQAFVLENAFRIPLLNVPRVLALAIEHELGHLLIPPLATVHSKTGIMKAQLDRADLAPAFLNDTGFSDQEGQWMREEIRRRTQGTGEVSHGVVE
jgi:hypothetical protein